MSLEHPPAPHGPRLEPLAVTIPDAIAISGIKRTALYGLIKGGRIRVTHVGKRTLVNYCDLKGVATGEAT